MTTMYTIPDEELMPVETVPAALCNNAGPVFNEPWEMQAFAMAVGLMDKGHFSRSDWAATLTDAIRAAQAAGDPDLGDTYYHHWMDALEAMCFELGLTSPEEFDQRKADWRQAYLNTPHGTPIVLEAAYRTDLHDHDHHDEDHGHHHHGHDHEQDHAHLN